MMSQMFPCSVLVLHPPAALDSLCNCDRSVFPRGPWLPGGFVLGQRDVDNLWLSSPRTPSPSLLSHTERALLKSTRDWGVCLPADGT